MRILLIIFLSCFTAFGATYHVATNGNDAADGSLATPWLTPYWALQQTFAAGDTINIAPGVYPMTAHDIYTVSSGTIANPILVNATNAILTGSGIYCAGSNWVFNGGTISNFTESVHMLGGFVIGAKAHHTIITNWAFKDFLIDQSQYGVVWYPDPAEFGPYTNCTPMSCAANCVVSNCLFTNFMGAETIRVGGSNNLIVNNIIARQMNGDVFQFFGASNIIRGNFVTNCFYRLDIAGGQQAIGLA